MHERHVLLERRHAVERQVALVAPVALLAEVLVSLVLVEARSNIELLAADVALDVGVQLGRRRVRCVHVGEQRAGPAKRAIAYFANERLRTRARVCFRVCLQCTFIVKTVVTS